METNELTHFNEYGQAKMVNVEAKQDTMRKALAQGAVTMAPETLQKIAQGQMSKGDVLSVAQIAGIMGAKRTSDLIPMCHNLFLTGADLKFILDEGASKIWILAEVSTTGKTGVEMEALTAVTVAALTIYDMCKAVDKNMIIHEVCLIEKIGGKSGHYQREGATCKLEK